MANSTETSSRDYEATSNANRTDVVPFSTHTHAHTHTHTHNHNHTHAHAHTRKLSRPQKEA